MNPVRILGAMLFLSILAVRSASAEPLVIDLDLENENLNLSHAIDGFFFAPTINRTPYSDRDLNAAFTGEVLRNHLAATAIVRVDGEIAGFATEQEVVILQSADQKPYAESAWLITLNRPGMKGVLMVKQREDASGIMKLTQDVLNNPDAEYSDRFERVLSTSGSAFVQFASDDLARYQGGVFEEYNFVNQADYKRIKRFRPKIQFVVYPKGAPAPAARQ